MPSPGESKNPELPPEEKREKIPIKQLHNIQKTMNELFSDLFSGRPLREAGSQESWLPAIDIYENEEAIILLMDIPGMSSKDIDITASPETIIVKGERKKQKNVGEKDYILQEHYYGFFSRTIPLPYAIKPREIKATYRDGTLELRLPRAKSSRGKPEKIDS